MRTASPLKGILGGGVVMGIFIILICRLNDSPDEIHSSVSPTGCPSDFLGSHLGSTTNSSDRVTEKQISQDPFLVYKAAKEAAIMAKEDTTKFRTLHRTIVSLIHIQQVYRLNRAYLGRFLGPGDFYAIGSFAYRLGLFEPALEWLMFAAEGQREANTSQAEGQREANTSQAGVATDQPHSQPDSDNLVFHRYSSLCRQKNQITSRGSCHLRQKTQTYGLWRTEVLRRMPQVVVVHDFLSQMELRELRQNSTQLFQASETTSGKWGARADLYRISETIFLDEESALIGEINRRIEDVTGLSSRFRDVSSDSEQLQMTLYGPGGVYQPHYDVLGNSSVPGYIASSGDRVATVILYLEEPQLGGATVFPYLDITLPPSQGSALFWFNLKRNGDLDPLTLHAGCPVILGHKLIAVKWLHEAGQWRHRPCALHPHL